MIIIVLLTYLYTCTSVPTFRGNIGEGHYASILIQH